MKVILATDASGSAMAGTLGLVVVVVDVIDFSTSMEAAIDEGAAAVYGACPDKSMPPVKINPFVMGAMAGRKAKQVGSTVVVLAEPRVGSEDSRLKEITKACNGIKSEGGVIEAVIPNWGAEIPRLIDLKGKVILGATGSGGVVFDAAVCAGAPSVLTGTVARTLKKNGFASAEASAKRALAEAVRLGTGIAVVAASGNSLEDILAAEYLHKNIIKKIRQ